MDGSGENTAEYNPQIGHRTELGTHDGTEDRTRTRNIQELDHENLPTGEDDIVHTVGLCQSWSRTVVRRKHTLHETAVEQVSNNERNKAQTK